MWTPTERYRGRGPYIVPLLNGYRSLYYLSELGITTGHRNMWSPRFQAAPPVFLPEGKDLVAFIRDVSGEGPATWCPHWGLQKR